MPDSLQPPPVSDDVSALSLNAVADDLVETGGLVAIAFLRWLDPTGVHHIVAFDPNPTGSRSFPTASITGTLGGDGAARLAAFVDAHIDRHNLYFQVNEVRADFAGLMAEDNDIVSLRALPADADPQSGDFEAERTRILNSFADNLKICPPSGVTDSGGGFWAFFRLAEKIVHDDQAGDWYRAQCRGVRAALQSDNVVNPSRVARLPGSMNRPDASKIAKGRPTRPASALFLSQRMVRVADLEQAFPPIYEKTHNDGDRVGELITIYQGGHYQSASLDTLDSDLQARFKADIEATPLLAEMVRGDFSNTKQKGAGGKRNSFATKLGSHGSGYDPDEFAEVIYAVFSEIFPDSYCDPQLDVRQMAKLRASYERAERDYKAASKKPPVDVNEVWEQPGLQLPKGVLAVDKLIDATAIPQRQYVVFPALIEGDVCQVVGEPGISKSSLMLTFALAVSADREDLICGVDGEFGVERLHRAGASIVFNAEDRVDEMQRRLVVGQRAAGITKMPHKVHVWSGIDGDDLQIVHRATKDGPLVRSPKAQLLEDLIVHTGAVFVALDPQVGLMSGGHENDADDMNALFAELTRISSRRKCAIMVVHHSAKSTRNDANDMGMGRGSFAQAGKVRSQMTLTNVDPDDAVKWGYSAGDDLFQLGYGKVSYGPKPRTVKILRRNNATVGNGVGLPDGGANPFEGTSAERAQRAGDSAPELEIIGLVDPRRGKTAHDAVPAEDPHIAKRQAVAHAALAELAGRDKMTLSEAWPGIGRALVEARLTKASSRQSVSQMVTLWLAGAGVVVNEDGQNVCIWLEKEGPGPTAGWVLRAEREELASLAGLTSGGVFA